MPRPHPRPGRRPRLLARSSAPLRMLFWSIPSEESLAGNKLCPDNVAILSSAANQVKPPPPQAPRARPGPAGIAALPNRSRVVGRRGLVLAIVFAEPACLPVESTLGALTSLTARRVPGPLHLLRSKTELRFGHAE